MWWKGWAVFGSILMMITGEDFQLLARIFALFNSEVIVQGYDGYYLSTHVRWGRWGFFSKMRLP